MASNSHLLTILKGTTLANICMCKQIVASEMDLDKTRVKLFPNFTSIPFDYLLGNLRYRRFRGDGDQTSRASLKQRQPSLPSKIRTLRSQ